MAVDHLSTQFPTFARGAAAARQATSSQYLAVWFVATTLFAALHTAVTLGASYWRYRAEVDAHDATVAAIDAYNAVGATLPDAGIWARWEQIGSPTLDLDAGAAVGQIVAATSAFGLLLAVALVLVAHGLAVAGHLAALSTGLSIAVMAGVLARTTPMIPVASTTDPVWLNLADYPAGLRQPRVAIAEAMPTQDTATWWNLVVAMLVALLALGAVDVARRVGGTYPSARPTQPVVADLSVVLVVMVAASVVLGSDGLAQLPGWTPPTLLLAMTLLLGVLSARASAVSGVGTALALSVGFVLVHVLLYAAFHRSGGAPGGWGVGTGGPQVYASSVSAAVLALSPVAGRAGGALWSRLPRRHEAAPPAVAA